MSWLLQSSVEGDAQFKDAIGPIVDEIKAAIKGAEENIDDVAKLKETINDLAKETK